MTLGDIIKDYRIKNDLSMDAFSMKSGISKAYISLLEKNKHPKTGKSIAPSIQCIKQAADGMGMDFNTLFSMIDSNVSLEETPASSDSDDSLSAPGIHIVRKDGSVEQFDISSIVYSIMQAVTAMPPEQQEMVNNMVGGNVQTKEKKVIYVTNPHNSRRAGQTPSHLLPNAANDRTDIEVTEEMKKEDDSFFDED